MKYHLLLIATVFCFIFSGYCQVKQNFDRGWKFHFGHAANPVNDFNYSIATIFSKSGGAANTAIDPKFDAIKLQVKTIS